MFKMFYGMQHTPFVRGIPTSVLYKTHQSSEVFSRLEYTARNQLFAVLIGDPGALPVRRPPSPRAPGEPRPHARFQESLWDLAPAAR